MRTEQELDEIIKKIRAAERRKKKAEKLIEDLKDELRSELDERVEEKVETDQHNIFYKCIERASVDTQKMKDNGVYDMYATKKAITQLIVTDK